MDEPSTLQEINAAIDAVRQAYATARSAIEQALGKVYANPGEATDRLLSEAEEFGHEHAAGMIHREPFSLGELIKDHDIPWGPTRELLERDLEPLIDHHDRLDHLTAKRDALLGREQAPGFRSLNIQGVAYDLDFRAGYLREAANPGKTSPIALETVEPRTLTLTEQARQDLGAGKAEPGRETPGRPRIR